MTDSDKPAFARAITHLALALREPAPDAAQLRLYFGGLQSFEVEYVIWAAERLMTTASWFPKLAEWRAACAQIQRERLDEQRDLLRRLPTPLCAVCGDTSWRQDGNGRVRPCECREARRQELLRRAPWPALPEGARAPGDRAADAAAALDALKRLGFKPAVREMPSGHDDERAGE
jgi:hypothetical protein